MAFSVSCAHRFTGCKEEQASLKTVTRLQSIQLFFSPHPPGRRIVSARVVRPKRRRHLLQTRPVCYPRGMAENGHRLADLHGIEKRNRVFLRETNATMGCRIARQDSGVHSGGAIKANKIMHRSGDKLAAARHPHVGVCIGQNRPPVRIYDPTIER